MIVCESDADCKYYASIRDTLSVVGETTGRRLDLLFTSCGGKHRIHSAVTALRAASVPVAVIVDFDTLNDWALLSRIVVAIGEDPATLEVDWKVVSSALMADSRSPSVIGVKEAVNAAFDSVSGATLDRKDIERIRAIIRTDNGWDRAKRVGLAVVPQGDPYVACQRLLAELASKRIHIVPLGELESLVPAAAGHGPAWVAEVLEKSLHVAADSDTARTLMREVVAGLSLDLK